MRASIPCARQLQVLDGLGGAEALLQVRVDVRLQGGTDGIKGARCGHC